MTMFGQTIRQLRTARQLTQRALAKEVGINFTYLSKIENNRLEPGQSPKKETIARLADALGTDSDDLLLLARKIPDSITDQIIERPTLFRRIACLDDETVEQVLAGLEEHKVKETLVVLNESQCILHEVLDSLPHNIAVLDQHGKIIVVNRSWRKFAVANGIDEKLCGQGTDYFAICSQATSLGPDAFEIVSSAIREILTGEREAFELEYPGSSGSGEQKYVVRVTRFQQGNVWRAVVSHNIVGVRQLNGIELQEQLARHSQ